MTAIAMTKPIKTAYRTRQDDRVIKIYLEFEEMTKDGKNDRSAVTQLMMKKYGYSSPQGVWYARRRGRMLVENQDAER